MRNWYNYGYIKDLLVFALGIFGDKAVQQLIPQADAYTCCTYVMVIYVIVTILFYKR